MKTFLANGLLCTALIASTSTTATTLPRTVEDISTGTTHRDLYALVIPAGGRRGIAVGDRGALLVTENGGQSWQRRDLRTGTDAGAGQLALFDVALSGNRWLVVGQMGLVRYSVDDGASWTAVDVATDERLLGVSGNADGMTVAVGSFGTILLSGDSGESWRMADFNPSEVVEDNYEAHLNDVHVTKDGTVLVVGEFGLILRSTDGGQSWHVAHQDSVSLFGLHMRANGEGYAVGQSGTVLHTTDGGESWSQLETGLDANLLAVHSSPNGTIIAPGMRHMIVSDDNGATWREVTAGDVDRNWYGTVARGIAGVYAAGHSSRVIRIDEREP